MRSLFRVAIWLAVPYLILCTVAALFLAEGALHPARRLVAGNAESAMHETASRFGWHTEDVEISASDNAHLYGWLIAPKSSNGAAVIVLHGQGDNRIGMTGYAEMLLTHGYSVLMPDARAHGASGGDIATYGVLERDDIRLWFEWLQHHSHPNCIFGLGESMGAAELLQSLIVEPGFCAVVAESPFATFREIAYDRMGQAFHAGPWVGRFPLRPVIEIALAYARFRYGVDLTQASPAAAVAASSVPVLLIHGEEDTNIPVRHSILIKARNSAVQLWEVPRAGHCGAFSVAPAEFERTVLAWFAQHNRHSL